MNLGCLKYSCSGIVFPWEKVKFSTADYNNGIETMACPCTVCKRLHRLENKTFFKIINDKGAWIKETSEGLKIIERYSFSLEKFD